MTPDTIQESAQETSTSNPQTAMEFDVTPQTFKYGEFEFFTPKPNPATKQISGGAMIEVMLLALGASNDPGIKSFLEAAKIQLSDVQNKLFFPRQ